MQDEPFKIKYVTANHCFLYLPEQWLRKLNSKANVVKVSHNQADYYLSWHTRPSSDNSACLSATFARTLNIKEGEEVFVSCANEAPPLTTVVVVPKSSQDREIIELQIENVQTHLLNQISIVAKNQSIVAWVSKFLTVTLIVDSLDPNFKYGRLQEFTEVHVGDAIMKSPEKKFPKIENTFHGIWNMFNKFPGLNADKPAANEDCEDILQKCKDNVLPEVYRVHEIVHNLINLSSVTCEESLRCPFNVFIRRHHLPSNLLDSSAPNDFLYKIEKISDNKPANTTFLKEEDTDAESNSFVVKVFILEDTLTGASQELCDSFANFTKHRCIFMTKNLRTNLSLGNGGKVLLRPIGQDENVPCSTIEVTPRDVGLTENIVKDYINKNSRFHKVLLNSKGTIRFDEHVSGTLKLLPEKCSYDFFDEISLRNVQVKCTDVETIVSEESVPENPIENISMSVLEPIVSECERVLKLSLALHKSMKFCYDRENILIHGDVGSGKTTICNIIRQRLSKQPNFVYTSMVDCKSLKGKKAEVVQRLISSEIAQAVYHQYSVIFLDDIECITSASSNEDENTPDAINAARITDVLYNEISECQSNHYVSLVATCTNVNKIGKKLRAPRGIHFFRSILNIPNLEKDDRIDIMKLALRGKLKTSQDIDWELYGNKTEGWVAQDLAVMIEKSIFAAYKRYVKDKFNRRLCLLDEDIAEALGRCTPIALHEVNLYKGAGHKWTDIGGLGDVKQSLIEILNWPLKYAEIFKEAPIKQQSGVLLYGMPGTGKTMLAGAIAKECGLNLISVKGPELLSKYIGASEEAVRNIFAKAQRAKPCVLFFDEFDSLAPRRGHDNTGVTDRVVNQLLTHLDGIEGREGVAVVAASSRPDLLDPALLRPGRLDKSLLCPLPNQTEREEILKALCGIHRIATDDLNLKCLASVTDGFTGADLNSVITQARLDVMEEAINIPLQENLGTFEGLKISQSHLMNSAKTTRPALPAEEIQRYNRIYSRFSKGETFAIDGLQQKATLA